MEHSIDEILSDALSSAYWHGELKNRDGVLAPVLKEALTAIYEIGLEVIGAAEDAEEIWRGLNKESRENVFPEEIGANYVNPRNELRASQRKAWTKACGVAI